MDSHLKQFIDYLFTIGIADRNKTKKLIEVYYTLFQERKYNKKNHKQNRLPIDTMKALLKKLFPHFNDEISSNLVTMYIENRKQKQINKLRIALIIGMRAKSNGLWSYYRTWKRVSLIQRRKTKERMIKPIKINAKSFNYRSETSEDKRQREELEECTFRPVVNTERRGINGNCNWNANDNTNTTAQTLKNKYLRPNSSNKNSIYDKLYFDKDRYNLKNQLLNLKIDTIRSSQSPFVPKLYTSSTKNNQSISINSNSNHTKFMERQRSFLTIQSKSRERIKTEIEDNIAKEATFSPKINSKRITQSSNNVNALNKSSYVSNYNNKLSPHLRLYNDHFLRKAKSLQRINTTFNDVSKNKVTSTQTQTQTQGNANPNQSLPYKKHSVDYSTIQLLYDCYKTKKLREYKTKQRVEEEEGLTFSPYLHNKDSKYHKNINLNFYEREQKLLNDKQQFIKQEQVNDIKKIKSNQIGFKNHYTQEEKDQITKRIIERLYNRHNVKERVNHSYTKITDPKLNLMVNRDKANDKDKDIFTNQYVGMTIKRLPSMPSETDQVYAYENDANNNNHHHNLNLFVAVTQSDSKSHQVNTIVYNNSLNNENKSNNNDILTDLNDNYNPVKEDDLLDKYNDKIILLENHPSTKRKLEKYSLHGYNPFEEE